MFIDPWCGDPVGYEDDPFNRNNSRNLKNTSRETYNCAGYALGTFSWYLPIPNEDDPCEYNWGSEEEIERNALSFMFVRQILRDFHDIRLIPAIECVRHDEYAIAFRVGNDDFHFIKQGKNGIWYEKRGGLPTIFRMTEREVFNTEWNRGRYNGPIFLFAKRCNTMLLADDE